MPKTRRRRGARLEMTSLMDVMFLVLVFFVYCIFDMTVHKGVKVDLPNAAGADDSLQLNGEPTTRAAVVAKVKDLSAVDMRLPVLISGDRQSSLGTGIEILSDLKAAGVEKVSFQVRGGKRD